MVEEISYNTSECMGQSLKHLKSHRDYIVTEAANFKQYISATNKAFSFNWPFVAFSGLNEQLVVANAFTQEYMNLIDIAHKPDCQIVKTVISDTFDLVVCVKSKSLYTIYLIDLEQDNLKYNEG